MRQTIDGPPLLVLTKVLAKKKANYLGGHTLLPCAWSAMQRYSITLKGTTTTTEVDCRERGEKTRIIPRGEKERVGKLHHYHRRLLVHCRDGKIFLLKALLLAMTK